MKLLLMRHAEAGYSSMGDAQRPLTDQGLLQAAAAGHCLQQQGLRFAQAWVSPYVRTRQTFAQCYANLADQSDRPEVQLFDCLTPDADPGEFLQQLATVDLSALLVITHQPLISRLLGILLHGDERQGPPMSPASMALLDCAALLPGCAQLQWLRHAPEFGWQGL